MSNFKEYFSDSFNGLKIVLEKFSPSISADGTGTYDYSYIGNRTDIGIAANIFVAEGGTVKVEYDGENSKLNASFNFTRGDSALNPSSSEVSVDKYSISFSGTSLSLFQLPAARKESKLFNSTYKDLFTPLAPAYKLSGVTVPATYRNYRDQIQYIIDSGNDYAVAMIGIADLFPFGLTIYRSLSCGIENEMVLRPTLRRTRSYSFKYAQKRKITLNQEVYKTKALKTIFFIPDDIFAILPDDPIDADTPPDSTWAWKMAEQSLEYSKPKRSWEESVVFEFAAFDNNLYRIIQ